MTGTMPSKLVHFAGVGVAMIEIQQKPQKKPQCVRFASIIANKLARKNINLHVPLSELDFSDNSGTDLRVS